MSVSRVARQVGHKWLAGPLAPTADLFFFRPKRDEGRLIICSLRAQALDVRYGTIWCKARRGPFDTGLSQSQSKIHAYVCLCEKYTECPECIIAFQCLNRDSSK